MIGESLPIEWLSPSRFEDLRQCPLRVAISQQAPRGAQSHAAFLGELVHDVYELMVREQTMWLPPEALVPAFDSTWSRVLGKRQSDGTDPTDWADYTRARLRARRKASVIAEFVRRHEPSAVCPEVVLRSPDGLLGGRSDLIVRADTGTEIVDYKTGRVGDGANLDKIERQLRIYAGIEEEVTGILPLRAWILSTVESWQVVEIDGTTCRNLLSDARSDLAAFNQRAPGPQVATPSAEACIHCPHSARCDSFWDSVQSDWLVTERGTVRHAVSGELLSAEISGNGTVAIEIAVATSTIPDLGTAWVTGIEGRSLPIESGLPVGAKVRIVGLRATEGSSERSFRADDGHLKVHLV
jgi:RecB family exonuclease